MQLSETLKLYDGNDNPKCTNKTTTVLSLSCKVQGYVKGKTASDVLALKLMM